MKAKYISFSIGCLILSVFLFLALFPMVAPYGLKEMSTPWISPCSKHIFGTNDMGYDIFTEIIYGTRDTLFIGLLSAVFTVFLGTIIGILASFRGAIGSIFSGIIQVFVLLPKMIILIVLAAFLGNSRWIIILIISLFSWVGTAREVEAKARFLKNSPFMDSLHVLGYSRCRIILFHMIPNLKDILLTRFLLAITSCIMMESTLSFIGLGDVYHASWGTMMNFAYKRGAFFRKAYTYLLAPGFCISLVSFSFFMISRFFEEKKDYVKENQ